MPFTHMGENVTSFDAAAPAIFGAGNPGKVGHILFRPFTLRIQLETVVLV